MVYLKKVLKNVLILLFTLLFIFFSFKLAIFYIPFLIGFIISLLIEPIIKFVSKKTKFTRKTSAVIVLILIFTILIGLIIWGTINLVNESTNLLQGLNVYVEKAYTQIQEYIDKIKINIPENVINIISSSLNKVIEFITKYTSEGLSRILQGLTSIPIARNIYCNYNSFNIFYYYRQVIYFRSN